MSAKDAIRLFEDQAIRSVWDEEQEEWYFSVVDVVGALTEQQTARGASTYWAVLKTRLIDEGAQLLTSCKQLKMQAVDGKMRNTDAATTEQILRMRQADTDFDAPITPPHNALAATTNVNIKQIAQYSR
jgi:hypothetical protein